MTRLLVSVRSAAEAALAVAGGADLVDVKEPHRGSLGAADIATMAAVIEAVAGRAAISVALGELLDHGDHGDLSPAVPAGVAFAKTGLAGCAHCSDWANRWSQVMAALPLETRPVAVVYADPLALAPPAQTVIDLAAHCGCAAVLVDTWDKSAGTLCDHWSPARIHAFIGEVQSRGMLAVVAGGLTLRSIPDLAALAPDFIAVRGAVCRGGRAGSLDRARVQRLKEILATVAAQAPTTPECKETANAGPSPMSPAALNRDAGSLFA